jgi:molybdopterin converting factor small subunit
MKVTVRLYGLFRKFGDSIALDLPAGSRVRDLERAFAQTIASRDHAFYENGALRASRFCDDQAILGTDHPLAEGASFSVLPPVSGG